MVLEKLEYPYVKKNEAGCLSFTIHKNQSKWIKDLDIRPETIKFLGENTLWPWNVILSWMWHQQHKQQKLKTELGLYQTLKLLHNKGNNSEKATCGMGERICKSYTE